MRTTWIIIPTAVLGCLIGLGLTCLEVFTAGDRFEASYVEDEPETGHAEAVIPPKAVVVGQDTFDFGTLEQNQSGTCKFTIRNESVTPLIVNLEGVSCGLCVQTELSHTEVESSDELEFEVQYTTHKEGPKFAEYVEVRTSDPDNTVIRFNLTGYVTQSIRFSRRELAFGNISAGEDISSDFRIYGFTDEPINITGHEFTAERTADYFNLELTPLELDDFIDEEPRAKSAVAARLTMTRGKPLGPIKQVLKITAQMGEETTEAEFTIQANIVSDILLIGGSDFFKENNLLRLRTIVSAVGHSTTVRIRIRGPHRDEVKLSLGEIDPPEALTAKLGEPTIVGNGYLYRLTVTIPKGAPSVNRLGSQQGKIGIINIKTTHPSAKELPLYVSFAVE